VVALDDPFMQRWCLIPGRPLIDIEDYPPQAPLFGGVVLSLSRIRWSSGRILHHNVDLGGMSPWDLLHLGMPATIPLDTPFPPSTYFLDITQDEDRVLFGGPYGCPIEVALQGLVSSNLKEWEEEEASFLDEIEEMSDDMLANPFDYGLHLELERIKLRIIRLRKRDGTADSII
jgi:hypothetical protein